MCFCTHWPTYQKIFLQLILYYLYLQLVPYPHVYEFIACFRQKNIVHLNAHRPSPLQPNHSPEVYPVAASVLCSPIVYCEVVTAGYKHWWKSGNYSPMQKIIIIINKSLGNSVLGLFFFFCITLKIFYWRSRVQESKGDKREKWGAEGWGKRGMVSHVTQFDNWFELTAPTAYQAFPLCFIWSTTVKTINLYSFLAISILNFRSAVSFSSIILPPSLAN